MGPWDNHTDDAPRYHTAYEQQHIGARRSAVRAQQHAFTQADRSNGEDGANGANGEDGIDRCMTGEPVVPQPAYSTPYNIIAMVETLCAPAADNATTEQRALYAIGGVIVEELHKAGNVVCSRDNTIRELDYMLSSTRSDLEGVRASRTRLHSELQQTIDTVSSHSRAAWDVLVQLRDMLDNDAITHDVIEANFRAKLSELGLTPEPEQMAEELAPEASVTEKATS